MGKLFRIVFKFHLQLIEYNSVHFLITQRKSLNKAICMALRLRFLWFFVKEFMIRNSTAFEINQNAAFCYFDRISPYSLWFSKNFRVFFVIPLFNLVWLWLCLKSWFVAQTLSFIHSQYTKLLTMLAVNIVGLSGECVSPAFVSLVEIFFVMPNEWTDWNALLVALPIDYIQVKREIPQAFQRVAVWNTNRIDWPSIKLIRQPQIFS